MADWLGRVSRGVALAGSVLWCSTALAETELTMTLFGGPVDIAVWQKLSADFEKTHPGI